MLTIRDGRIQRNDAYMNGAEMARQLGALPPAGLGAGAKALTGAAQPEDAPGQGASASAAAETVRRPPRLGCAPWRRSTASGSPR